MSLKRTQDKKIVPCGRMTHPYNVAAATRFTKSTKCLGPPKASTSTNFETDIAQSQPCQNKHSAFTGNEGLLSARCDNLYDILSLRSAPTTTGHLAHDTCEQQLFRNLSIQSTACLLQYTPVLLPMIVKLGLSVHEAYEHRMLRTRVMEPSACCLQYSAVVLPSTLKLGAFVHVLWEQRRLPTSTIASSACCLQYISVFLPMTLKLGCFGHEACEHRMRFT